MRTSIPTNPIWSTHLPSFYRGLWVWDSRSDLSNCVNNHGLGLYDLKARQVPNYTSIGLACRERNTSSQKLDPLACMLSSSSQTWPAVGLDDELAEHALVVFVRESDAARR